MTITHKVLVSKDTGRIQFPVYTIDDPRPCALDCEWHYLTPGTAAHTHLVLKEDVSHLDMEKTYWDFEANEWVEVPSSSFPTFEMVKYSRNEMLRASDKVFAKLTDSAEIQAWVDYRQQLRTMFDNIPANFNWATIVFPRNPRDIAALKEKAAQGDTEAIAIIERDGL
jgi:hypothetical protein